MQFEMFIYFGGNCREALDFYAKVFQKQVDSLMTYDEMPLDSEYTVPEADIGKVMYAGIRFDNMVAMFCDMPSEAPFAMGNNFSPTLNFADKAELERVFNALSEGGSVDSPLQKTFYSELYGSVTDKFGVNWQILYYVSQA